MYECMYRVSVKHSQYALQVRVYYHPAFHLSNNNDNMLLMMLVAIRKEGRSRLTGRRRRKKEKKGSNYTSKIYPTRISSQMNHYQRMKMQYQSSHANIDLVTIHWMRSVRYTHSMDQSNQIYIHDFDSTVLVL